MESTHYEFVEVPAKKPLSKSKYFNSTEVLACILGIKDTRPEIHPRNERERVAILMAFLQLHYKDFYNGTNTNPGELFREGYSNFCAFHLPELIDLFLKPLSSAGLPEGDPELTAFDDNPYFHTLALLQTNLYFKKYLRSTEPIAAPKRDLAKVLVGRALTMAPIWDPYVLPNSFPANEGFRALLSVIQMLTTLESILKRTMDPDDILPEPMRKEFTMWLHRWGARFPRDDHWYGVLATTSMFLTGSKAATKEIKEVWNEWAGWDTCDAEGCKESESLKECSKCRSVRYCSVDHQKKSWRGHKYVCFETIY